MVLLASIFRQATRDPVTYRRVDTSSAAGVAEASRNPSIMTDLRMGLGLTPEDSSYRSRMERTRTRAAPVGRTEYGYKDKYGNITNPALSPEAIAARQRARRGPTAAERRAQRKAAELAERKRLGQIARKKFEKEKGERVAKKRATLLNIT